jgi:FkbM family methyltransferase
MKIGLNIGAGMGESLDLFSDFDIIHCFEPATFSFNKLQEINQNNLVLHNYGISDIDGYKTLNVFDSYGYSSLLDLDKDSEFYKYLKVIDPTFDTMNIGFHIKTIEKEATVQGWWESEIKVKRLDTFINENNLTNIDLIKIDTQGHDLNVVKSLGNYMNIVNTIMLECQVKSLYKNSFTKEDIVSYMEDNNFELTNTEVAWHLGPEGIMYFTKKIGEAFEENLTFKNKKI